MTDNKNINYTLFRVYKKIWEYTPKARRLHLLALTILMLLTSIFEVVSIGAIIPFLGILTSPDKLSGVGFLYQIVPVDWHSLDTSSKQLFITIIFSLVVTVAGLLRVSLMVFHTVFRLSRAYVITYK